MKFFKWFYPGIGIKRWIILCSLGLGFIVLVALLTVQTMSKTSVLLASFATALLILGISHLYLDQEYGQDLRARTHAAE